MRDALWLNGKEYRLARENLLPSGARRWAVGGRPSQPGDPSKEQTAEWKVSGPNLNSFEVVDEANQAGLLGVDYTTGVDTRWTDLAILGPATTVVDCSTGDTLAVASTNGMVLGHTLNATARYLYVIRGREPKKIKLSTWTAYDSGINLAEAATDIEYTKTAAGTEEITIGMAATALHIVSAIGDDAAADTNSANNESKKGRILGKTGHISGEDNRVIALDGQTVQGNVLTGSVTMDASAFATIDTLVAYNVTPTGFALDRDVWILGYDIGPVIYDELSDSLDIFLPNLSPSTNNCKNMVTWTQIGVLIPMERGLRYIKAGQSESIGPERFLNNSSPVSGRFTALAGTDYWLYGIVYDEPNDDSYLVAGRPRQPGDAHPFPVSWYVLKKFTDTNCDAMLYIGNGNGALTNPHLVSGHDDDIFYVTLGRYFREIDDSNYRFQTAGILYLTELRRQPGIIKDLTAVEFTSSSCGANDTITVGFSVDGGAYNDLSGTLDYSSNATLNGVVNTNGFQRILFVDNSNVPLTWATGRRIKPRLTFAANANTASPKVEGTFRLYYKARPVIATTYEFVLQLDESQVWGTVEDQADQLMTELGSGPLLVNLDPDNDSYYVRVEDVQVKEAQERGGGADRPSGPVRLAFVKAVKYPSVAGD